MSAAARLGGYAVVLVAVFLLAYTVIGPLVPQEVVTAWTDQAQESAHLTHPGAPEHR